jgi:hypothetical protein
VEKSTGQCKKENIGSKLCMTARGQSNSLPSFGDILLQTLRIIQELDFAFLRILQGSSSYCEESLRALCRMDNVPENLCTSPFKGSHLIILLSAQHISIDLLRKLGLHRVEKIRRSYIIKECLKRSI